MTQNTKDAGAVQKELFEAYLRKIKFPVLPVWQDGKPHQNYALELMWQAWGGAFALAPTVEQAEGVRVDALDAARYRFLRDSACFSQEPDKSATLKFASLKNVLHDFHTGYIGENFDADVNRALDKAIAAAQAEAEDAADPAASAGDQA